MTVGVEQQDSPHPQDEDPEKDQDIDQHQQQLQQQLQQQELHIQLDHTTSPHLVSQTNGKSHEFHLKLKSSEDTSEIKKEKAIELIKIIKDGTFQDLLIMLKKSNVDLNFFINGQTALHYSLLLGRDLAWCKELVSNGANPNLANSDGWHPIHLAAFRGLSDTMCYLIDCNSRRNSLL